MRHFAAAALALLALAGCGGGTDAPAGSGADHDAPVSSTPSQPSAVAPVKKCTLAPSRVVGRTQMAAMRLAERHGCVLRVIESDGVSLAITDDYSPSRINVAVRDGVVTAHDGRY